MDSQDEKLLSFALSCSVPWRIQPVVPQLVQRLAAPSLPVKKLASDAVIHYAKLVQIYGRGRDEHVGMATNTLVRLCASPDPLVRAWAVRSVASFEDTEVRSNAAPHVYKALGDSHPQVRRAATLGCLKMTDAILQVTDQTDLYGRLGALLRDDDPHVLLNSLNVLTALRAGGATAGIMNRKLAYYLARRLPNLPDFCLIETLAALRSYEAEASEEALELLNIVDPYLKHGDLAVVLESTRFFLALSLKLPEIADEVKKNNFDTLVERASFSTPELLQCVLCEVQSNYVSYCDLSVPRIRSVLKLHVSEPNYLKTLKLKILKEASEKYFCAEMLKHLTYFAIYDLSRSINTGSLDIILTLPKLHSDLTEKVLSAVKQIFVVLSARETLHQYSCLVTHYEGMSEELRIFLLELLPLSAMKASSESDLTGILGSLARLHKGYDQAPHVFEDILEIVEAKDKADLTFSLVQALWVSWFAQFCERAPEYVHLGERVANVIREFGDLEVIEVMEACISSLRGGEGEGDASSLEDFVL